MLFYMRQQTMVITVPNMNEIKPFFSEISQQINKMYEKRGYNYSNLAYSQILFDMHQQPTVPDHDTQYEENPASHHGGMQKNGQTDWTLSYISQFHLSRAGNNKGISKC